MICQLNILEEHQGLQDYYRALCANIGVRLGSITHNKVLHDTAVLVRCVSHLHSESARPCVSAPKGPISSRISLVHDTGQQTLKKKIEMEKKIMK